MATVLERVQRIVAERLGVEESVVVQGASFAEDLGADSSQLTSKVNLVDLFVPVVEKQCEFIEGDNEEEAGRNLALKLREAKLI